jgi:beta-glucosidase
MNNNLLGGSRACASATLLMRFCIAIIFPAQGLWGATSWMDTSLTANQRANLLVAEMTLVEKLAMVHGSPGPCVGNGTNISRLGIPALCLQDGPAGVADGVQGVTALPAPILLAATWDTNLARQYGTIIGKEARGKGVHISLGPMLNLVRVPQGGRDFEMLGEDPYLAGTIGAQHIRGIQSQGVSAGAKHFVCNDHETNRGNEMTTVDERTLHEIYFPPFLAAIRAGVGSITAAYNGVNGLWSSESPLIGTALKGMFGFKGFVDCDWGANFAMQVAINNGLDLEMPYQTRFGMPLRDAVQAGTVTVSQLDDMVRRILFPLFQFGIFDNPPTGNVNTPVTTPAHAQFARQTAQQGMVLLKNNNNLLPLNPATTHSIAVCGTVASVTPIWVGLGSAQVYLPYYDDPLRAISNRAGAGITITYNQGDNDTNSLSQAVAAAQQADVAIVCVGQQTGEGIDRVSLSLPPNQEELVNAVAAVNAKTIVVLYEGAGTLMPWDSQVAATLVAWYPGQENGTALASILFGDVNPSGKLPVTFPAAANEVPANTPAQFPGTNFQVFYSEGLFMGYRWYDASNIAPRYPFGHGKSYTTFAFSNLTISTVSPSGQITIGCNVRNTGTREGAEVAQLYLGFPGTAGEPPLQLKGFKKTFLAPGASSDLSFNLFWEDIAYWDVKTHQWIVPVGTFQVMIGASSRDIRLTGNFSVLSPVPSSGVANRALFSPVTASSISGTNYAARAAADGDPETRWASGMGEPQWLAVDLGAMKTITRVRLNWDVDYARNYLIQVSNDGLGWSTSYMNSNGAGGVEDLIVSGSGRYVRFYGTQSSAGAGYSLKELEIYSPEVQTTPSLFMARTSTNTLSLTWPVSWGGTELFSNIWLNWGNYTLEQNTGTITTNWVPVAGFPTTSNGTNEFIVPNAGLRLFRLKSPWPNF